MHRRKNSQIGTPAQDNSMLNHSSRSTDEQISIEEVKIEEETLDFEDEDLGENVGLDQ